IHPRNPFHAAAERRTEMLPEDFCDRRYTPSHVFNLTDPAEPDYVMLCDWITLNYARVPRWFANFVARYDTARSLRENVGALVEFGNHDLAYEGFRTLAGLGLFLGERDGIRLGGLSEDIFDRGKIPRAEQDTALQRADRALLQPQA